MAVKVKPSDRAAALVNDLLQTGIGAKAIVDDGNIDPLL
jgi:hypothetical protein